MSVNLQNKKKLGIGIAAVAAAAITLGAGTYAFFSSTGTPTGTNASAGTLVLNETASANADLGPFVPGGAPQIRTLSFKNDGSVTANLRLGIAFRDAAEDGCKGDEGRYDPEGTTCGSVGELSRLLKVKITREGTQSRLCDNLVKDVAVCGANLNTSDVEPGDTVVYHFEYYLPNSPDASDNMVQGDSLTVTTTATLQQP